MVVEPMPAPPEFEPCTVSLAAEHIHVTEEAVQLEIDYRRDLAELGVVGSEESLVALEELLPRLDNLKAQLEPPHELEIENVSTLYGLLMSLCRARFVLEYPPEEWEANMPSRSVETGRARFEEIDVTVEDIDAAIEPFAEEATWTDDVPEHFFYIRPPSAAPEDELLRAIARQGGKEHVMREVSARRNPEFSLSVYESPEHFGVEGASVDEQAAAFVESWNETRANLSEPALDATLANLEENWGPLGEEYVSRAESEAAPNPQ